MEGLAPLLTRAGLRACLRAGAAAPRAGGPLLAQHPVLLATLVLGLLLRHHGAQAYRGRGQAPGRQAPNPYTVLGLDQGESSEARIKFAYRNLVKQYHPDKAKDKSEKAVQRFHEVQEAYETLTDPQKLQKWRASQHAGRGRRGYTVHYAGNAEAAYNRHRDGANFHWNAGATIHSQHATDLNGPLFMKTVFSNQAWVVQIYDDASARCREEAGLFEQAARVNAEVAKFGRVRFSWFHHLARKMVAHVGLARTLRLEHLPLVLVYSPACGSFNCGRLVRGRMTKAKIEDLLAQTLRLPKLPELTRETLYAFVGAAPREKTVVVALIGGDKGVSSALWRHFALQHKHLVLATMRVKAQDEAFWRQEARRVESVLRGGRLIPTVGDLLVFSDRRPLIQQIIRKAGMEKSVLQGIKGPLVPPLSPRTRKRFKDCEEPAACLFATGAHVGGLLDLFYDLKSQRTKFPEASASWPRRVKKLFDSNTLVAGWIDHKRQRAFLEGLNVTVPRANETALIYFQRKVYRKGGRRVKNVDPYIGEDIIVQEFRDPQHADASSLGMEDLIMWVDRVADYGTYRPSHRPMEALRPPPEPLADWGGWARFCGMYYDVFGMSLGPLVAEHYPVLIPLALLFCLIFFLMAIPIITWVFEDVSPTERRREDRSEHLRAAAAAPPDESEKDVLTLTAANEGSTRGTLLATLLIQRRRAGAEAGPAGMDDDGGPHRYATRVLKQLAKVFDRETKVQFCVVDTGLQPAWAPLAKQTAWACVQAYPDPALASEDVDLVDIVPLVVWSPSRNKSVLLGFAAGGRDVRVSLETLANRVERLLDGSESWNVASEFPALV